MSFLNVLKLARDGTDSVVIGRISDELQQCK